MCDAVDAARAFLVNDASANVGVVPVNHPDAALGSGVHVEAEEMVVVRDHEIAAVRSLEAGTASLEVVHVQQVMMNVAHERLPVELLRERATIVNLTTAVREAALALAVVLHVELARRPEKCPATLVLTTTVVLMHVIGNGANVRVDVRIEMPPALPMITPALNHVPQVRDDTRGDERLSAIVKIQSPRIARAPREHLELVLRGMITPHAGIDALALGIRRAGLAHVAVREHAVTAVQPAVRSPREAVERLVPVLPTPSIQHHLRFAVRLVVAVFVGNKIQIRGRPHPHSTKAHLQPRWEK